jgi:hypothetical protein
MPDYTTLDRISKEAYNLMKIFYESFHIIKNKEQYLGMSLEELSLFYDEVENGLISYNFIMQDTSQESEAYRLALIEKNKEVDKFFEAQLLNIVAHMITKHPCNIVPQKFKESLWNSKLKDKEYYNLISNMAGILPENREWFYKFLQK